MWQYNFTLRQWTFLKGNSTPGAYTTHGLSVALGVEGPTNLPAGRNLHTLNAMSSTNAFIMFGGYTSFSSSEYGEVNDLWRYNVTSNNWCLLKGNIRAVYPAAVYGTIGIASSANVPAGVYIHGSAFVPGTDSLFVFGGYTGGNSNELWLFNCSSAQWTFFSSAARVGVYTNGAQFPGARSGHSFVAIPNTSLFVMVNLRP